MVRVVWALRLLAVPVLLEREFDLRLGIFWLVGHSGYCPCPFPLVSLRKNKLGDSIQLPDQRNICKYSNKTQC